MKKAQNWIKEYTGKEILEMTGPDDLILFMSEYAKDTIDDFVQFLLENGYCDTDVYAEPPTAIDRFMHPKIYK